MDQRCHTFSFGHYIKRLVHHAVYCISLSCLLSFLCNPYIPFLIYEIFNLLVIITICQDSIQCNEVSKIFYMNKMTMIA